MAIEFNDADDILKKTISFEIKHAYYDREAKIALFCSQIMTEEGHKAILEKKNSRLSEEQLEERVEIYTPVTRSITSPIRAIYRKGYGSDNIRDETSHSDNASDEKISEALGKFHAGSSVQDYMKKNFIDWNFLNPNAWLLTERTDERRGDRIESISTYPFLVKESQAINYSFGKDGEPEWLIVELKSEEVVMDLKNVRDPIETPIVSTYYLYTEGLTITYTEYVNKKPEDVLQGGEHKENITLATVRADRPNRNFVVEMFETGSEEFPGGKVGANSDPESPYFVKVPPYYDAEGLFIDIIDDKANLDVIKKKHVYPHRHEFVSDCDFMGEGGQCIGGHLDGDESKPCSVCQGTGFKQFSSAQDKRVYPYPKHLPEGSPFPELSKMIFNEEVSTDEVKLYDEFIDKNIAKVTIAMFGVTSRSNPNPVVSKTATEVDYEELNVNNPVLRVMELSAEHVMRVNRLTAQYMGFSDGFETIMEFSKDLKINSLTELLIQYGMTEGMDSSIRWGLQCDIMTKVNVDMPHLVLEAKVKNEHTPFPQLSEEQVVLHLETLETTDRNKLLYLYSEVVWRRIKEKNPNFTKLSYKVREIMIDTEIVTLRTEVEFRKEDEVPPLDFSVPGEGEEEKLRTVDPKKPRTDA